MCSTSRHFHFQLSQTDISNFRKGSRPVWPDFSKFRHFVKILKVFVNFLRAYLVFGKFLTYFGKFCMSLRKFHWRKRQNIEKNKAIWSHGSRDSTPAASSRCLRLTFVWQLSCLEMLSAKFYPRNMLGLIAAFIFTLSPAQFLSNIILKQVARLHFLYFLNVAKFLY